MTPETALLEAGYVSALTAHIVLGEEATLSRAYELGRVALSAGMGVIDSVVLHHEALGALLASTDADGRARVARCACEFFAEFLSPFEMTFRGYREANHQLRELNRELVEQKRAIEYVNRELEAFSYSVSHDLRAPLRSIDGFSLALLEDYSDLLDEEGRDYLRHVRQSTHHMQQLIDALLSLALVSGGALDRTPVDLSAMASRVAERLARAHDGPAVHFELDPGVVAVCDARLAEVAMTNLLGNAWKFTSKRDMPRIAFGVLAEVQPRTYFVRDNGAGFDSTRAQKLFGAFHRMHSSTEFEGTGIGLATVQRIVHRHGGTIWSEAQIDRGATFLFTLGEQPS